MSTAHIRRLYAYTDWANELFLDVIRTLSDEQFAREIVSSFSSIRDTVAHVASAEWIWLRRWSGESPLQLPEWMNEASLETLEGKLREIAAERNAYLDRLGDQALDVMLHYRSVRGDPFALPLREVLVHCANHSTYHRGQLATMLRQLGAVPPTTDYSLWARTQLA